MGWRATESKYHIWGESVGWNERELRRCQWCKGDVVWREGVKRKKYMRGRVSRIRKIVICLESVICQGSVICTRSVICRESVICMESVI